MPFCNRHIDFPVLQCIQLNPLQKSPLCYFCKRFCNFQWRIQWTCRFLITDLFTCLTCTGVIAVKLAGKCTVLTTLTCEMVPTVIVSCNWLSVVEEILSVEEEVVSVAGTPTVQVYLYTSGFLSMVATISALMWFSLSWSVLGETISPSLLDETGITATVPFCTACTLM